MESLREKCSNTDQKKLRIGTLFTQILNETRLILKRPLMKQLYFPFTEAALQRCSYKKVF